MTSDKLRELRRYRQLSPVAAAELCFVSSRQWMRYESGLQPIPKYVWQLLIVSMYLTENQKNLIQKKFESLQENA